jgi:poly(beta-D-mannuronate) lyase
MRRPLFTVLLFFFATCATPRLAHCKDFPARSGDEVKESVRQAQAGDSIILANGTWQDTDLLLEASGTAENPITLRAETPGQVKLTGHSRVRLAGRHLVVSGLLFHEAWHESALVEFRKDSKKPAVDCRFTNCAMLDCNPPQVDRGFKYVSLYGHRNRVDHCRLEGKRNEGATLVVWLGDGPAEHRIDHVHFGPRPRLGKNGGESIRVGDSTTSMVAARVIVEQNHFEQCSGEVEIISNKSCENIYRHNTFVRCEGALTLRHGNRCLVEGNYFLGEGKRYTGGVRIIGEGHRVVNNYFADLQGDETRAAISMMNGIPNSPLEGYFQVKDAVVAFNTLVNCKWNMAIGLGDKKNNVVLPPKDCAVANNLFLVTKGQLLDQQTEPQEFLWQGNLVEAAGPIPETVGRRVSDLRFRQSAGGIWRPSADSPVVGAAQGEFPFVTEDIDGHARSEPKDAGCHRIATPAIKAGPLMAGDVGISWETIQTED